MSNRYVEVIDGVVTNIIVGEDDFCLKLGYIQSDDAHIGDTYENGVFTTIIEEETYTLDELKEIKIKELHDYYTALYDQAMTKYTNLEKSTFEDQKREYNAWMLDDTTPTPIVDTIATNRGVDRVYLLERIGQKILEQSTLIGKQQKLEDLIEAATTEEELDAINIEQ